MAVSAFCLFAVKGQPFLESLKEYRLVLNAVLKDGKATETSILLNGVAIIGDGNSVEGPRNCILVSGEWRSQYYFSVELDSDDAEEIQSSRVASLSVEVRPNVDASTAPL